MSLWAVILAAGQGSRLARAGLATRKQYLEYQGRPLYWHSARTLARVAAVQGLVLVFPAADLAGQEAEVARLDRADGLGLPWRLCAGGERRQDSVAAGLAALPPPCRQVLVHDAARPLASATLVQRLVDALSAGHVAAIPGLAVTDTIKRVDADGLVQDTPPRSALVAVQTPQAFDLDLLRQAHALAASQGWEATDDAMLVERLGRPVRVVAGEAGNIKITHPEDLTVLAASPHSPPLPVTGSGYDVHKYGPGRPMVLAGVPIPGAPEVVAHSDGDVLLHAVTDAVLGCACLGDIGEHFPDTDPAYSGIASAILLAEAVELARVAGVRLVHCDATIIAQVPRISPHKAQIRAALARMLGLPEGQVNVKATTEEGLGFTGQKLGIKAAAVVSGWRQPASPTDIPAPE